MKRLSSRKICAALVIITWLATLVSLWGMTVAGRDAIAGNESCDARDTRNKSVQLHTASSSAEALRILSGDPDDLRPIATRDPAPAPAPAPAKAKAECIRRSVAAQVRADLFFLIAYSALTLALFLFVRASRGVGPALLALGLIVALAMAAGDAFENWQVLEMIDLARKNAPPDQLSRPLALQHWGGLLKWGALGLSAALLAVLWRAKRLAWIPRALGIAAAAVIFTGLVRNHWPTLTGSMAVLGAFWLSALIHAVAVAIGSGPDRIAPASPEDRR